jgi:metacaspase-1
MHTKKALLIGINYIENPTNSLKGCWEDVKDVKKYLIKNLGFKDSDIKMMTDEIVNRNTTDYPSKDNIISAIKEFSSDAKNGDNLFFHYSGHGGSVLDLNGDELDGKDECIYPAGLSTILDEDIFNMLVEPIPEGVKLRCIFDCCHSGSGLDLPLRIVPSGLGLKIVNEEKVVLTKDVVSISGCKDDQTSADAKIGLKYRGALTASLLKLLEDTDKPKRWKDFIKRLDALLVKGKFEQIPQLSISKMDLLKSPVDL